MAAIEQCFSVVILFIMLYKVVQTFTPGDGFLSVAIYICG